jgi:hypothetical protein
LKKETRDTKKRKFIGLRRHTHTERAELLKAVVVPMLRRELGKNLIAIAADGSFARYEDRSYSDLELMIFVKSSKDLPVGFSKIHDGLLVEGLFVTEEEYHRMVHEPNRDWYIAGSDKLMAITNPRFVHKLETYRVKNLAQKCDEVASGMLNEIQEAFGKLQNAIDTTNQENLYLILSDAVMAVLRLLAFINRKPYKSLNSMISEARELAKKPRGFDDLMDLLMRGEYNDMKRLRECSQELFSGIEELFKSKYGSNFYDADLSTINRTSKTRTRR